MNIAVLGPAYGAYRTIKAKLVEGKRGTNTGNRLLASRGSEVVYRGTKGPPIEDLILRIAAANVHKPRGNPVLTKFRLTGRPITLLIFGKGPGFKSSLIGIVCLPNPAAYRIHLNFRDHSRDHVGPACLVDRSGPVCLLRPL